MHKRVLLVLFMSMAPGISASQDTGILTDNSHVSLSSSYASQIISCVTSKTFCYLSLAGLGVFCLYKLAMRAIRQEEERLFDEHQEDLDTFVVSKKDFGIICDLIEAMESDMETFDAQPARVKSMDLTEFDSEDLASGCEGMRGFFYTVYEQCIIDPENKAVLAEIINIFKQTIEEKMVVAELPL